MKSGGKLVVNADALASLPLLGMSIAMNGCSTVPAGANVTFVTSGTRVVESQAVRVCPVAGADR